MGACWKASVTGRRLTCRRSYFRPEEVAKFYNADHRGMVGGRCGPDGWGGGFQDPPIPTILSNYAESLWGLLVSVVAVRDEGERIKLGGGGDETVEELPEAGSPPQIFWDTSVPVEQIRIRLMSLRRRFAFENGGGTWIPRNNNQPGRT